ncbi:MAG: family 78 glycoside hydrolase catalytic domain [Bacteroidales bacterium]
MKKLTYVIPFLLLVISCTRYSGQPVMLKCEYDENPLGIDNPKPRFSWAMNDTTRLARQKAWQIMVATTAEKLTSGKPDMWDSHMVRSDVSQFIPYDGKPLQSATRYYWKVRYWDRRGCASAWSDIQWFETAFLKADDWKADWIAAVKPNDSRPPRSVLMRKEFLANKELASARLYITGLGNYVAYINGQRVGNDLLTPGWTDYRTKVQYQVYDVTAMIQKGQNAWGAVLGNMWWSSGLGWQGGSTYSNGPLRLMGQLCLTYSDGTSEIIPTDTSWQFTDSPIVYNHIYHGETYDARMEIPDWSKAGTPAGLWKKVAVLDTFHVRLVAQQDPPIRVSELITPVSIAEPKKGIYVFDFGQNMVGWARLSVQAPAGTVIEMRFAELLHDDGTVAQENLRQAKATDRYICKGQGTETWEPMFTYHGFRYVQVTGLKEEPTKETLTGIVIHSSAPFRGKFECSDTLLNQIWKNITWGQRGNMMSVPTDCPQRDERLGWMGDAQIFAPTAFYNMNMNRFFVKWLRDIADCQDTSGYVYDVNPAIVVGGPAKPGWGDAVVVVPYVTYLFTGDRSILEENYDAMKKWIHYMDTKAKNHLYEFGDGDWGGYGDWVAVVPSPTKPTGGLYYYYSTKLLSEIAGIIGKKEDSAALAGHLPLIAQAYNAKYFYPDSGHYIANTQSMNLLPVAFGLAPENLRAELIKKVAENVVQRDTHLTTGFMGTAYLLPLLSDYGYHDLAWKVATQTTYPSWGYMVKKGATTIWELWNSDTERPEGMNSRNHFAYGSVGEWYYRYLAGIQPDIKQPGFKRIIFYPRPVGNLTYASADLMTGYGQATIAWKKIGNQLQIEIQIPANTSGIVRIPFEKGKNKKIAESGKLIWKDGKRVKSSKGLTFVKQENNYMEFEAGAGKYHFLVQ